MLVDNASYSFALQIDNGIPILPFYDSKEDVELKYLVQYLLEMQNVRDVREYNRTQLKLNLMNDTFNGP